MGKVRIFLEIWKKKHGKVIVCSSYLPPGTFLEPWGTEDHGWCCGQQTLRRGGISVKITLAEEYARWWVFKKTKRKRRKIKTDFLFFYTSVAFSFSSILANDQALLFFWSEWNYRGEKQTLKFSLVLWLIWSFLKSQVSMCFCFICLCVLTF